MYDPFLWMNEGGNMISRMNRAIVSTMALSLVHCGGVSFDPKTGTSTANTAGNSSVSGVTSSSTSGGSNVSIPLPVLQMIAPPCLQSSECLINFNMSAAASQEFSFTWQTNDSLYLQTPPAGEAYGQPGVTYVSTSGRVIFQPGENVHTVFVQNINTQNETEVIGVVMSNCQFAGVTSPCTDFFQ
jgi:hypothetical protein